MWWGRAGAVSVVGRAWWQMRGEWGDLATHAAEVKLKDFADPERRSTMRDRLLARLLYRWL